MQDFARFSDPMNKKILKGKPQTSAGLSDDETTTMEVKKVKLMEPQCWTFHVHQAPILMTWTLVTSRLDLSSCSTNLKKISYQSHIGLVYQVRTSVITNQLSRMSHNAMDSAILQLLFSSCQFDIRSDHEDLKWILHLMNLTGKLTH